MHMRCWPGRTGRAVSILLAGMFRCHSPPLDRNRFIIPILFWSSDIHIGVDPRSCRTPILGTAHPAPGRPPQRNVANPLPSSLRTLRRALLSAFAPKPKQSLGTDNFHGKNSELSCPRTAARNLTGFKPFPGFRGKGDKPAHPVLAGNRTDIGTFWRRKRAAERGFKHRVEAGRGRPRGCRGNWARGGMRTLGSSSPGWRRCTRRWGETVCGPCRCLELTQSWMPFPLRLRHFSVNPSIAWHEAPHFCPLPPLSLSHSTTAHTLNAISLLLLSRKKDG